MVSKERSKDAQKVDYNYGIDLFRILAMIMVIILHILSHGGIWESSTTLTIHNELTWLLGIGAYCAVNSYALISGYVGYGKKRKYSNLFYLYFEVLFYTLTSTALFAYFKPEWVTIQLVINAIIPFLNNTYWYFIGYFCLFFFMPFFNIALDTFDKVTIEKLLFTMFIIFSLFPTLFHSDIAFTNNGFSFLWLASMYITGAWIKKRKISEMHYNNKINLLVYLICVIFTWFSKILIEILNLNIFGNLKDGTYLISYTSPTIIVCSVTLLLFFFSLELRKMFNFQA